MTYSFIKSINDIRDFQKFVQNLINSDAIASNLDINNYIITSSSVNTQTNLVNINFSSTLTNNQYMLLEWSIMNYTNPTPQTIYKNVPYLMNEIDIENTTYTTINSFPYLGSDYTDTLKKINVNSRLNTSNLSSSNYYDLRVINITKNTILGSNLLSNVDYNYNNISLSNIPTDYSLLELQGRKNGFATSFNINSVELIYLFK